MVLIEQRGSLTGNAFAFVAADVGGDEFPNTGHALVVSNGSGSDIDVTFVAQGTCNFNTHSSAHDSTSTVPAGEFRIFGPFEGGRFNDNNGRAHVTYSDVTDVTVACILP